MLTNFLHNFNLPIQAVIVTLSSFAICFVTMKYFLKFIDKKQICRQPIRKSGPESHLKNKQNTPTMGGLVIIFSILASAVLFLDLSNNYVIITLFTLISFALIGFIDDYKKVTQNKSKGFRGSVKLVIQFFIIGIVLLALKYTDDAYFKSDIFIPFIDVYVDLGVLYILFAAMVIVGCSNSVNLTDGLDGLVSVPIIFGLLAIIVILHIVGNEKIAEQLSITNIENISQLTILCVSVIGAIIAFLKYNIKPAKIFMGDVGSLSLGATLGALAVITKQEVVFGFVALLFVAEALSVILQVSSYKFLGKRIFLMAPIHHHFEKLGWSERKVVRSFWLASFLFAIIGLSGLIL